MKIKSLTQVLCVTVLFLSAFLLKLSSAEEISAEVINVNLEQGVVFVDIGRESVAVGDVFYVDSNAKKIYLQVIGADQGVSKLGVSQKNNFQSNTEDLASVTIGLKATRIWAVSPNIVTQEKVSNVPVMAVVNSPAVEGMPAIDPAVLVKPDITHVTIQDLDSHLDKMAKSNLQLYNSLAAVLTQKKQWQTGSEALKTELQNIQKRLADLNVSNADMKKKLDDENFKLTKAVEDQERYKKLYTDGQARMGVLREKLDHLTTLVNGSIK